MTDSKTIPSKPGIYLIRNTVNGKVYIGRSENLWRRWATHRSHLKRGRHQNRYLLAAWQKHGAENFTFEVLELAGIEEIPTREAYYIGLYKATDRTVGYNLAEVDPEGKPKVSAESRRKMSASQQAVQGTPSGKRRTEAIRRAKSQPVVQMTLDGLDVQTWPSAEATKEAGFHPPSVAKCCRGIQAEHRGFSFRGVDPEAYKPGIRTEETRAKMREAHLANAQTETGRKRIAACAQAQTIPVIQLTLSGKVVKVWSQTSAPSRDGFVEKSIVDCCLGKRESYKAFHWTRTMPDDPVWATEEDLAESRAWKPVTSRASITWEQVREIRRLAGIPEYDRYGGKAALARKLGLPFLTVSNILNGVTWKE